MPILRNKKQERYAQLRAAGKDRAEALADCGYKLTSRVENKPHIKARVDELVRGAAARAELSRKVILDRILADWDLARKLGQVSAGLKAAEMLGKELFKMFVDRREIGGPGDFDNKSEEELREFINKELKELGLDDQLQVIQPPTTDTIN